MYNVDMPKLVDYNPPPDIQALIEKSLMPGWTGQTLKLMLKNRSLDYAKRKLVRERSLAYLARVDWPTIKELYGPYYEEVAAQQMTTTWNVNMMQFCAEYKQGVTDRVPPTPWNVGNAGMINSPFLGGQVTVRQAHPISYDVAVKVPGTRGRRIAEPISEYYPDGVTLGMGLAVGGPNPPYYIATSTPELGADALIRITIRHYKNAFRIAPFQDFTYTVPITTHAEVVELPSTPTLTPYAGYDVIITVRDVAGSLFFDNVELYNDGFNYARDWRCKNVRQRFTANLATVLPNWELAVTYPGVEFLSRGYNID